ncbi:ABC transporter ATP-binding protein [Weissella sp. MSCH1]|uniref:ABC transporter ATP-binding protein n=1 Tax=Weissella sp. MSCH1 TaxID=3383343 RepID=UPI003896BCB9
MDNLLQLDNIYVSKHHNNILNGVSLNIPSNQIFGLLGDNGAGKTTLLKSILLMNKNFSGSLLYNGKPLSRQVSKDFGALIESPALYPNLTARENLMIMVKLYDLPYVSIDATLVKVGLNDTNHKKKVKNFSLGMRQRLGIAMAIIHNPSFLILDEPTNGLDINGVEEFKEIIARLKKEGMTIMITTHQITELSSLFDSFAILKKGNVVFSSDNGVSSPEELRSIYQQYNR